jgi:ATP-dependent 26S proteasome regulatory subunit
MYTNKVISPKVNLENLAHETKNYTGAEIQAVV